MATRATSRPNTECHIPSNLGGVFTVSIVKDFGDLAPLTEADGISNQDTLGY